MHVPNGFLDLPTSAATAGVAVVAVGLALRERRRAQDDRVTPMAGLTAVFIMAAQMVNFPVGAGTSGHLLGGALAAVLVGPWMATLCLTAVLIVQALLFADGGLTALGTNVVLMGVVGVWVAWWIFRAVGAVTGRSAAGASVAAAVAGLASVPAAAATFAALYAIGGAAPVPLPALFQAMIGWHVVIGLGEGVITGLIVSSVLRSRPDLVYGAAVLGVGAGRSQSHARPVGRFGWAAIVLSALVAGGLSMVASARPDGLEHVAATLGFGTAATEGQGVFADYALPWVSGPWATAGAGLLGTAVVGVLLWAALKLLARRRAT